MALARPAPVPEWVQRRSRRKVPCARAATTTAHASVARTQRPPLEPGSLLAPRTPQCELGRPFGWPGGGFGFAGRWPGAMSGRDVAFYVDDAIWRWQGLQWAHWLADGIDELHRFAAELGINRLSYQGPPRTSVPHYDLTA